MNIIPVLGANIFDFGETILDFLQSPVKHMMSLGMDVYNALVGRAAYLLLLTPKDWAGNEAAGTGFGWDTISNISTGFEAYGTALVAFFFLMGLYSELKESKFDIKLESILFDVLKLMLATYLVTNSFEIISKFSTIVIYITQVVCATPEDASGTAVTLELAKEFKEHLDGCGAGDTFVLFIFALIFDGVLICAGVAMLLASMKRMMKLLVIIPWGSIVSSTFAGNHQVSQSGVSFWKWTLGTLLEATTMLIAIVLFSAMFKSDVIIFENLPDDNFSYCSYYMLEKGLLVLTCSSTVSGASDLTHRALSL